MFDGLVFYEWFFNWKESILAAVRSWCFVLVTLSNVFFIIKSLKPIQHVKLNDLTARLNYTIYYQNIRSSK